MIHEDIAKFYKTFTDLNDKFFIIDKIGEGTFSCVYKAVDLNSDCYDNEWDYTGNEAMRKKLRLAKPDTKSQRNPNLVAIKRVFVTSSPTRIANELTILSRLFGHVNVAPLITAMRCQDQVLIILPYFSHVDFRQIYHLPQEMKPYFKQLFRALAFIHDKGIIHRDVKPQNFLYDVSRQHGVLVDFGLAEYAPRSHSCAMPASRRTASTSPRRARTAACAERAWAGNVNLTLSGPRVATPNTTLGLAAGPTELVHVGSGPQRCCSSAPTKAPKLTFGQLV